MTADRYSGNHQGAQIDQARDLLKDSIMSASKKYKKRSLPGKVKPQTMNKVGSALVTGLLCCISLVVVSALIFLFLF
jgi:hypothetical protein